jgi:hypothetical protein
MLVRPHVAYRAPRHLPRSALDLARGTHFLDRFKIKRILPVAAPVLRLPIGTHEGAQLFL